MVRGLSLAFSLGKTPPDPEHYDLLLVGIIAPVALMFHFGGAYALRPF